MADSNTPKVDFIPVVELGIYAIRVPYHTTWAHEHVDDVPDTPTYQQMKIISVVLAIFKL